jgi:hypothetical protein
VRPSSPHAYRGQACGAPGHAQHRLLLDYGVVLTFQIPCHLQRVPHGHPHASARATPQTGASTAGRALDTAAKKVSQQPGTSFDIMFRYLSQTA